MDAVFKKRLKLFEESQKLWEQEWELEYGDPKREALRAQRLAKDAEHDALDDEHVRLLKEWKHSIKLERKRFSRPQKGVAGLFSRPLGPLPDNAKLIHPTQKNLTKVGSYRLAAFGLMVGAISLLLMLVTMVPVLRTSPASLIAWAYVQFAGEFWGGLMAVIVCICLMLIGTHGMPRYSHRGKILDRLAMQEEQWFRMGAEKWTMRQRVVSCFLFGAVHVTNIIYPIASIIVVGLVGAVFMAVYLRVHHRTQSTKRATLAAAKLHATYNRFALAYMVVALLLSFSYGAIAPLLS